MFSDGTRCSLCNGTHWVVIERLPEVPNTTWTYTVGCSQVWYQCPICCFYPSLPRPYAWEKP